MRATKKLEHSARSQMLVDTPELQRMLCSGRKTAVEVGTNANARTCIGRRVFWNVAKIQKYLDGISE